MDRITQEHLKELIEFIKSIKITNGVFTTYDHAIMEKCKYAIIEKIEENYNGQDSTLSDISAKLQ